jgi:hypothetical protein
VDDDIVCAGLSTSGGCACLLDPDVESEAEQQRQDDFKEGWIEFHWGMGEAFG